MVTLFFSFLLLLVPLVIGFWLGTKRESTLKTWQASRLLELARREAAELIRQARVRTKAAGDSL